MCLSCEASPVKRALSTWYLVLGTWYLVLGTWYLVLGTWYLVLGTGYWVLGTGVRIPIGILGTFWSSESKPFASKFVDADTAQP